MRPAKFIDPLVLRKHVKYDKATGQFSLRIATKLLPIGHVFGTKYINEYLNVWIAGKSYRANRAAWVYVTGKQPKGVIDHENGWKHDNRWENLRDLTLSQNALNRMRDRAPNMEEP